MDKKEYEEKFVVLNKKHLDNLPEDLREDFRLILAQVQLEIPTNKYYVCNQDEVYSKNVIETILTEGNNIESLQSEITKVKEEREEMHNLLTELSLKVLKMEDIDKYENSIFGYCPECDFPRGVDWAILHADYCIYNKAQKYLQDTKEKS